MSMSTAKQAVIRAGIPAINKSLYHRIRFSVGDPAVLIELPQGEGRVESTLILRDIEMKRAREQARADRVACPADFAPESGLSGDRETATAQAAAEFLRRASATAVVADRTLPLIYAHQLQAVGITVVCDLELGVADRRAKDEQEIEFLREAQHATEGAMEMACRLVGKAQANADGSLAFDGAPLTAERIKTAIDVWLLERGYENPESIVAGGPTGADCHNTGAGILRTGEPVIIDIFPRNRATGYYGDCTRTTIHGDVPDWLTAMHAAVLQAKQAATQATRAGATGEQVHLATSQCLTNLGFSMGLPPADAPLSFCSMPHGTGHGIGLDVHEPPLLDRGGPELIVGDALTIEPGLYRRDLGGVRVEDMVVVTSDGCENLNQLPTGLTWR
ncbi:MAG: aminopeptidase P family protein [Planctomycetales bacterium]|nr:aminopeptidase P family protein [Planctomycetales bacterium]